MRCDILHARIDGQWFDISSTGVRTPATLEAIATERGERWAARVGQAGDADDILCWGNMGYVSVSTGETPSIDAVRRMPVKEITIPAGDELRREWVWWTIPGGVVQPEVQAEYDRACVSGVVEFLHDRGVLEFGYPLK